MMVRALSFVAGALLWVGAAVVFVICSALLAVLTALFHSPARLGLIWEQHLSDLKTRYDEMV